MLYPSVAAPPRWLSLLLALPLALGLVACQDDPTLGDDACYPAEVESILVTRCQGCHAPGQPGLDLHLNTYANLLEGYQLGAVVVPYAPDWSHLMLHVNWDTANGGEYAAPLMPYKPGTNQTDSANLLTTEELATLRQWIENGAPNCEGVIPWENRMNTGAGKLFVLNSGSDMVTVLDLETNLIMRHVPLGVDADNANPESPHFLTLSPDGQYFYVTLIEGGVVEKYRTSDYTRLGRVEVGDLPAHVKLSADGRYGLVTNWTTGQDQIVMFDTETMTVIDRITDGTNRVGVKAHGLEITSDFRYVYFTSNAASFITRMGLSPTGFVRQDIRQIPLADSINPSQARLNPYDLILDEANQMLYITLQGGDGYPGGLVFGSIAGDSFRVEQVINHQPGNPNSFPSNPRLLKRLGNKLYVASATHVNATEQGQRRGCVAVVDIPTQTWQQNIYNIGHQPHGLAIDPTRNRLYVTLENQDAIDPPHHGTGAIGFVNVVDLTTNQPLPQLETEVGNFPNACELLP